MMCRKIFAVLLSAGIVLSVMGDDNVKRDYYTAEGAELLAGASKDLVVLSNVSGAVAKAGENINFRVIPAEVPKNARYIRVYRFVNAVQVAQEDFPIQELTVTMKSDEPAHLMVNAVYLSEKKGILRRPPVTAGNGDGVFVEPEKFVAARPRPADFDAFWDRQLQQLAAVPMTVSRKVIDSTGVWQCEDVEIASVAGIPVKGYLVMPRNAAPKSLPAVVCFQGAGFKSALKRTEFGDRAIVFDVNAHGVPNGMSKDYYYQLNRHAPADRNIHSGKNDPEKSYFKNMYLRTARALDFVRSLPEWDGRTLIVFGRSQGGAQSIAAAALVPEVTLCIANVPALTDHAGGLLKRRPGWPQLNRNLDPEVAAASDYIDVINLAGRIKCEVIMSAGMIDVICPPIGVYLAYKNISNNNPKRITLFPRLGHNAPPQIADGMERVREELSK